MLKVEKKVFEKVIVQIITSNDLREVLREFSLYRVFFYSLLKDILKGKDSPNYHILRKIARDRKISERFIIEQAKLVLSHFVPEEPAEDYYEVLNVSPTASSEEIRKSWINLIKAYHPDHIGDTGLDITKSLNKAYEVLGDPAKRKRYDAGRITALPVVVSSTWTEIAPRKLVYSFLLPIVFLGLAFYLSKSGLLFPLTGNTKDVGKKIEDKAGYTLKKTKPEKPALNPSMKESSPAWSEKDKPKGTLSLSKEGERILATQKEVRTEKISGEEKRVLKPEVPKSQSTEETPGEKLGGNRYVVRKGDNLTEIAKRFKISVKNLEDANNLESDKIDRGDVLLIPGVKRKGVKGAEIESVEQGALISRNEKTADSSEVEKGIGSAQQKEPETKYHAGKYESVSYPDKTSLYFFVSEYVSAYKNRDIGRFLSFFEPDARENGVEISKTLSQYADNFSSLEIFKYDVRIRSVEFKGDKASVDADFLVTFRSRGREDVRSSIGTISWLLSPLDGGWKIKEINYKIKGTR